MTTTRQLASKSWIVCWLIHETDCRITEFEDALLAETCFKFQDHVSTYKLSLTGIDKNEPTLELTLEIIDKDVPDEDCPQTITAIFGDNVVDLYSTERGKWRSVDVYSRSCSELFARNAIFYLLLEFKEQKSGEERVIERMSKLLDDQSLSDVWFVVKGHEIGAHWAIVNSASHVMAAMFDPEQFKLSKRVMVDDTEPEVFKQLLRYIYTGTMPNLHDESMAEPLFLAADKYKIEGLKEESEKRLIFLLDMNNVIHLLVLAYTHSAANLLEAAIKFISSNKKDIWPRLDWKDLVKQYPDLFFLASRRMNDAI